MTPLTARSRRGAGAAAKRSASKRRAPDRTRPSRSAPAPRRRGTARHEIDIKRAYEKHAPRDGVRVLVDRLWPRGLGKAQLAVDLWLKDIAPSDALRRWYGHDPRRWPSFAARYRAELARRSDLLDLIDELRRRARVTLLYGARDRERNNAVVLRDFLEQRGTATASTHTKGAR